MKSGIYKITILHNNKFYIGSSIRIEKRFKQHLNTLRRKKHYNTKLQNSFNKYGEKDFKFEILSFCPKEYTKKLEQWFIDNLKPEYNICKTATGYGGDKRGNYIYKIGDKNYKRSTKREKIYKLIEDFNKNTARENFSLHKTYNIPYNSLVNIINGKTWKECTHLITYQTRMEFLELVKTNQRENGRLISDIINIIEHYNQLNPDTSSIGEFCKKHNISVMSFRRIRQGKLYPELNYLIDKNKKFLSKSLSKMHKAAEEGILTGNRKLIGEIKKEIINKLKEKQSVISISKEYNISRTRIYDIKRKEQLNGMQF